MPAATPAQLSYDIVRQISLFRGACATAAAGQHAKHLRLAKVRHFSEVATWDPASSSDLAASQAALSSALLHLLSDRNRLVDLVEVTKDAIQGLALTDTKFSESAASTTGTNARVATVGRVRGQLPSPARWAGSDRLT